ncbi:MAG: hypothetical protein Q4F09_06665 [Erysipelotrichaceae bacterium]|nr:hypothetical protein [Erysipelotrichaceae bacterium]
MKFKAFIKDLHNNRSSGAILLNSLLAALSLFFNGFGIYLTIQANIGAAPWDVLNLGLSKSLGILYGTASITVAYIILVIDILLKEPIGIAMFIDAFVVGKSVDFFNRFGSIPKCTSLATSIPLMILGLIVIACTQYVYMAASLGCGPRDTLLVALAKRAGKMPIGLVSILMLSMATFVGWLLGGQVGIGTLICAFCAGPIMQAIFRAVHFDATAVHHQHLADSFRTIFAKASN